MALSEKEKDQVVTDLINNEGVDCVGCDPWNEEDREALNALPEEKLIALNNQREMLVLNASEDEEEEEEEEEEVDEDKNGDKAKMAKLRAMQGKVKVIGDKKKPVASKVENMTAEQWLEAAPPEIRSVVHNAISAEKEQKNDMINKISANERNLFTEEYLQTQSVPQLKGLVALATNEDEEKTVPAPVYMGAAGITQNDKEFVGEDQEMVPEPFDWSA